MTEETRTKIADDNDESRQNIHKDDTAQIKTLSKKFDKHIKDNNKHDKIADAKIDQLLPLVALADPDVIETIKSNAEIMKSSAIVAKSLMKLIGALAVIVTLIYTVMKIFKIR